jgi:hypothetical protein
LGEIMDVRRVYVASAKVRRTLNHQPPRAPSRVRGPVSGVGQEMAQVDDAVRAEVLVPRRS